MEQLNSPLQPRTESPVLRYIQKDYEEDFRLPMPLLEQSYSQSNSQQWEYHPNSSHSTSTSPFLTATYDYPPSTMSLPNTPDKKKRDPYSIVISKIVYMFLQHLNNQTALGISSYDDLHTIFLQRNTMIPLMTRQYCTVTIFSKALHFVQSYADLEYLLDEMGLNLLNKMTLDHVFASYLKDDQVILRKFYTHVDLTRKKEKQAFPDCKELAHISRVWNNICKIKKKQNK